MRRAEAISSVELRSSNCMIHWAHLGVQVRNEEDFEALRKLLDALGLHAGGLEIYKTYAVESFQPSIAALEVFHRKDSEEHSFLELTVSDPDTAAKVVKGLGLEITEDDSSSQPGHDFSRHFSVHFSGGTQVKISGFRTHSSGRGFNPAAIQGGLSAKGLKFAIVVSRFNSFIVERLLAGALDCLYRSGIDHEGSVEILRVPGSFEIPSAARSLAETQKYDAIICLGCLIRGDTAHYDVIVNEVTRGIGQSAQETGVPHAFGVLTCENLEQAIDRAGVKMGNKGFESALAAIEMGNLKKAVVGRQSLVVGKNKSVVGPRPSAVSKVKNKRSGSRRKRNL